MKMHNPPSPGEILSESYLKPLSIEPAEFAARLGIALADVNELLAGRYPITAELALRLSITLSTTPEIWMGLQNQYDLWHAQQRFTAVLEPYDLAGMAAV